MGTGAALDLVRTGVAASASSSSSSTTTIGSSGGGCTETEAEEEYRDLDIAAFLAAAHR